MIPRSTLVGARSVRPRDDPGWAPRSMEYEYWIRNCEGFRACGDTGSIGVVEYVRFGANASRPECLVVLGGLFATREWVIPVDHVTGIDPDEGAVQLRSGYSARPTGSGESGSVGRAARWLLEGVSGRRVPETLR